MAVDQNTDYQAIINQKQSVLSTLTPGTTEYQNTMSEIQAAENSRNEKIAEMNAAGTNKNNYQQTYNYTNTNLNGGKGSNTTPTGFTGSATTYNSGSGDNAAYAQQLVAQMNANSKQWYGASAATQAQLEQQNKQYAAQIQALGGTATYDSDKGTWAVTLPEAAKTQSTSYDTSYKNTPDYGLQSGSNYYQTLADMLAQQTEAAKTQNEAKIDYATQQSITELTRALEDAQGTYKTNQEQIASNALSAMDNSALYAEMRGDKGGIGQAQYNEIQNTAAINAQTVKSAQTKLATDTNRQIADLRAQGEFEKADAVLELTQNYLSSLIDIQQWAAEYDLDVAQFQETIRQWQYEYELKVAEITGEYQGEATLAAKQYNNETLASTASALLSAGVMPNAEQLASLGMTEDQAQAYILANQVSSTGSGGNGGSNPVTEEVAEYQTYFEKAAAAGASYIATKDDYREWLLYNTKLSSADIENAVEGYATLKAAYDTQSKTDEASLNAANYFVNLYKNNTEDLKSYANNDDFLNNWLQTRVGNNNYNFDGADFATFKSYVYYLVFGK